MNTVNDFISQAGKPLGDVSVSQIATETMRASDERTRHVSGWGGATVNDPEAQRDPATDYANSASGDAEVNELLLAVDEKDPLLFKQPRYFMQTQRRRGFLYSYRNGRGEDIDVTFDTGMYVTRDRELVTALENDIARADGIGRQVVQVSAAYYEEIRKTAGTYANLRAASGSLGSNQLDAHEIQRSEAMKAKDAEIAKLSAELAVTRKALEAGQTANTELRTRDRLAATPNPAVAEKGSETAPENDKPTDAPASPLNGLIGSKK